MDLKLAGATALAMGVQVDEAGAYHQPGRIDSDAISPKPGVEWPRRDHHNAVALHADVADRVESSLWIDDAPTDNNDVKTTPLGHPCLHQDANEEDQL